MGEGQAVGERVLHVQRDFPGVEIRLVLSDEPPPSEATTSTFALASDGDRMLMTEERERGLNTVGGGIEPGETLEEALRREAVEEAAAELTDLELLAYQRVPAHDAGAAHRRDGGATMLR